MAQPVFRDAQGGWDAEIAAFEDDPDAVRLTVKVSVVVRVTREKVLDRFAREVFAARRDALVPEDFAPLAYRSACEEGRGEVTGGPGGQLAFLVDPGVIVTGIPGVTVEDASMVIEPTPGEVVRRLREDHGFLDRPDSGPKLPHRGDEPSGLDDEPF